MKFTRCGLDIAKQVFQVHGVNEHGVVKGRKTLPRLKVLEFFAQLPPCLIGIEACAGAHYWARELTKFGHTVKLMAAQYVAAYRKRSKNDANDAEAICEAVGRPNMRFVAIKSEEQQAVLMVHRARALVVANRTAQVNQIRGLLGEFGLVVPRGVARLRRELPCILEDAENGVPALAREVLCGLLEQLREADQRIGAYDRQIRALAEASEPARRLMRVEAIGPQTATALVATVGDPHVFKNGRGLPPGWESPLDSIRPAAKSDSDRSLVRAMATCEPSWCTAPAHTCASSTRKRTPKVIGRDGSNSVDT
jgi:transposase